MPRVNGVMQLLPGTYGAPNTSVASVPYNAQIDDFVNEMNSARPPTAGGTGANTPAGARNNLGLSFLAATGSANALLATPTIAMLSYVDGDIVLLQAASTNTGAATLGLSGLSTPQIRKIVNGADVPLVGREMLAKGRYIFVYDAAANSAAGAWILTNPSPVGAWEQIQKQDVGGTVSVLFSNLSAFQYLRASWKISVGSSAASIGMRAVVGGVTDSAANYIIQNLVIDGTGSTPSRATAGTALTLADSMPTGVAAMGAIDFVGFNASGAICVMTGRGVRYDISDGRHKSFTYTAQHFNGGQRDGLIFYVGAGTGTFNVTLEGLRG